MTADHPETEAPCTDCNETADVETCTVCQKPVCPRHRSGTGRLKDGYQCAERPCWYTGCEQRLVNSQCPECRGYGRFHKADCSIGRAKNALTPARDWTAPQVVETLGENLGDRLPTERERAVCDFFEALLKVEYPGRRIAVTVAPLPDMVADIFDATGVLDVTIGPLPSDAAWVCFRCIVQEEVTRKDWPAAAARLLDTVRAEFRQWPGAPSVNVQG